MFALLVVTPVAQADVPQLPPPLAPISDAANGVLAGPTVSTPPPSTAEARSPSAPSVPPPPAPAPGKRVTSVVPAPDLQRPLVAEINRVRRRYLLRALAASPVLTRAAVQHAQLLGFGGFFSHDWSDGTPFRFWIQRFYPPGRARLWSAGENLLWDSAQLQARTAVA